MVYLFQITVMKENQHQIEINSSCGQDIHNTNADKAAELAVSLLGPIRFTSSTIGYCECPGTKHHTTPNGPCDCIVYLDNVPTISCFHTNCEPLVKATNVKLREAFATGEVNGKAGCERLTSEQRQYLAKRQKEENVRKRAFNAKGRILTDNVWPYETIIADSPTPVPNECSDHWRSLLNLFEPGDVIWIGDKYDSGKPEHVAHFKTKGEWLQLEHAPAPYICPSTFKSGSHSRGNNQVDARRFLVVESDTLNKDQVGSIFRWLQKRVGLSLKAIVDTAGKSLHGWFTFPSSKVLADLELTLPVLECDPKLFTASQPVRLPGALREGKHQRLIYLSGEEEAA